MMHKLTSIVGILLAVVIGTSGIGFTQDKSEVVGFSVAKKDAGSDYGQSYIPGTQAGLQIYLRVSLPKKTILKVDGDKTSLKVKDSSNKELAADENSNMSFGTSIADDKHSAILPVQCSDFPSAGSTSLTVSGEATLNCGADPKSETVNVVIKQDSVLELGPVTAKVTQIGDGFQPETKSVELEGKNSFDQIESLVFLDATGKEIETSRGGSSNFGDITFSQGFQFKGNPADIAKAKISYFQKIEAVKVPVDVKFGMDLGK